MQRTGSRACARAGACSECVWTMPPQGKGRESARGGGGGGEEIVERGQLPVAPAALPGVGVAPVVEELELEADRGARPLFQLGVDVVLDPAVGAGGQPELELQLEGGESPLGDDVAPGAGLAAAALDDAQLAVPDLPAFLRKPFFARAPPARCRLPVPEEGAPPGALGVGERVGRPGV